MIQLITQAIGYGYTAQQILNFIGNKIPGLGKGLNNARKQGYNDEDILKFLQGKIKSKSKIPENQNPIEKSLYNADIKTKEQKQAEKAKWIGGALGAAGTALGAYQLYKNYSGIATGVKSLLSPKGPQPTPSPMQQTPGQMVGQSMQQPGQEPNVPTPPQGQTSQPITQEQINTAPEYQPEFDFLKRKNLVPKIQSMVKGGKSKEEIVEMLKKKMPMMEQEVLRSMGPGGRDVDLDTKLGNIVDKFFTGQPNVGSQEPNVGSQESNVGGEKKSQTKSIPKTELGPKEAKEKLNRLIEFDAPIYDKHFGKGFYKNVLLKMSESEREKWLNENGDKFDKEDLAKFQNFYKNWPPEHTIDFLKKASQETPKEQMQSNEGIEKPIEVGSEVITPDGNIAKIEVLPGKTAKVDSDGKKNVYETDDLVPVPENKEEILQIYDKLINAIPESARSTLAAAIGYDAQRNKVQIKFHDGTSYNYDDIDQEDIDSIINLEHLAKTTGGNYFGVYFEGEPSLGAGLSKLIKRLQQKYGGKGKEYSAKFKEIYSLYAIPEGQVREREKKEREERKRAKRNA